jgi:glycopeptide antibiotics resistance protein
MSGCIASAYWDDRTDSSTNYNSDSSNLIQACLLSATHRYTNFDDSGDDRVNAAHLVLDFLSENNRILMNNQASGLQPEDASSWSNRVLTLAVAGILFLTLYPFRFSLHASPQLNGSPFLLVSGLKSSGPLAAFLNILLFVPFGFGLSQKLREKGKSGTTILLLTPVAGAFLSYCIEFAQIYIPTRDSGWEDVFTNAVGAAVGYFTFALVAEPILNSLPEIENRFERFLTVRRALWLVLLYFAIWFVVSVPLQAESRLSNWVRNSQFVIGNDATGHLDRAWSGDVSLVQLWSRALPPNLASEITAGRADADAESSSLATYLLSGSRSFEDKKGFLSALTWTPGVPDIRDDGALDVNGKSWLTTRQDVSNLVQSFQNANSFSIRVVCTPAGIEGADGRIISISNHDGIANLSLWQRDANLVFWFRNSLSVRRDQLPLNIPEVFTQKRSRDILVSYDGSNLVVYIDGKRDPRRYELTPGVPLAQIIRHIKVNELEGYTYIYYALVFIPGGVLLSLTTRRIRWRVQEALSLTIALVLPCIILEMILVRVSGRAFSFGNVFVSALFTTGGFFWINADRQRSQSATMAADQECQTNSESRFQSS